MGLTFTKKLLKDWDGRLVILSFLGKGIMVYDFTITDKTDDAAMQKEIEECMELYAMAYKYTLDWKEYVDSDGPGDTIVWKDNMYLFEGGDD